MTSSEALDLDASCKTRLGWQTNPDKGAILATSTRARRRAAQLQPRVGPLTAVPRGSVSARPGDVWTSPAPRCDRRQPSASAASAASVRAGGSRPGSCE